MYSQFFADSKLERRAHETKVVQAGQSASGRGRQKLQGTRSSRHLEELLALMRLAVVFSVEGARQHRFTVVESPEKGPLSLRRLLFRHRCTVVENPGRGYPFLLTILNRYIRCSECSPSCRGLSSDWMLLKHRSTVVETPGRGPRTR